MADLDNALDTLAAELVDLRVTAAMMQSELAPHVAENARARRMSEAMARVQCDLADVCEGKP